MAKRKTKKKTTKKAATSSKKKTTKSAAGNKNKAQKKAKKTSKPGAGRTGKKTTVKATKKSAREAARGSSKQAATAHSFYEHQVYAASSAYALVESSDPSELVRQVQIKCNDGWATIGGISHSGKQFYQALLKQR